MARLARLGPARDTLQLGAVLGIEFTYELLLAVSPLNENELRRHLLALTDAELLYERVITESCGSDACMKRAAYPSA
jgi:predicted ATPase